MRRILPGRIGEAKLAVAGGPRSRLCRGGGSWDLREKAQRMRQGEVSGQWLMASSAHAVDLSWWQEVQGLGILYRSVMAGEMNRKVWA